MIRRHLRAPLAAARERAASLRSRAARGLQALVDPYPLLRRSHLVVRDVACLRRAMGWSAVGTCEGAHLRAFEHLGDLNERRLRDAEVIAAACRNEAPRTLLEIGTGLGHTTALMAANAPQAMVHTVNIAPEEIASGGVLVTGAPSRAEIGRHWREQGLTNVRQIYANTATWEPDIGPIDVAFIDGCHDASFVVNDTLKVLERARPGAILLWHDFAPDLARQFDWIADVCEGLERLLARRALQGPIFQVRDSWVGVFRVPGAR